MRPGIAAYGVVLLAVAGVLWILTNTGTLGVIRIPIPGTEVAVEEQRSQQAQMFNMLAILLGFAGLIILIAGLATSEPQVIVREVRRSID